MSCKIAFLLPLSLAYGPLRTSEDVLLLNSMNLLRIFCWEGSLSSSEITDFWTGSLVYMLYNKTFLSEMVK